MKNAEITKSIWVGCLAFAASLFLAACGDESPFSKAEEDLDDIRYEANDKYDNNESEADRCYYGESDYSDAWCCDNYGYRCSYVSSSSGSRSSSSYRSSSSVESSYQSEENVFLYKDYSLEIDLTWFKQLTDNWEDQKKHIGDYSDGDPAISFGIKTYADNRLKDSVKTKVFKPGEDLGTWSGHEFFTLDLSGGVNEIYICPFVSERNMIELNVSHSSNYCYIISNAGNQINKHISQNDYMATDYELEWGVYIQYK